MRERSVVFSLVRERMDEKATKESTFTDKRREMERKSLIRHKFYFIFVEMEGENDA